MDLQLILSRTAEGIVAIDAQTSIVRSNQRTGEPYLPGVKTMTERLFVNELVSWWRKSHPEDLRNPNLLRAEVPYPQTKRASCDMVFYDELGNPTWAIEVKYVALAGNNGKNNDFSVSKVLSPYLKDRSLKHDIERMRHDPPAPWAGVVAYGFDYDLETCARSRQLHPDSIEYIMNLEEVCRRNDPVSGEYLLSPLAEFADAILNSEGLVLGPVSRVPFDGAWRHPCGGRGLVFGWTVNLVDL